MIKFDRLVVFDPSRCARYFFRGRWIKLFLVAMTLDLLFGLKSLMTTDLDPSCKEKSPVLYNAKCKPVVWSLTLPWLRNFNHLSMFKCWQQSELKSRFSPSRFFFLLIEYTNWSEILGLWSFGARTHYIGKTEQMMIFWDIVRYLKWNWVERLKPSGLAIICWTFFG